MLSKYTTRQDSRILNIYKPNNDYTVKKQLWIIVKSHRCKSRDLANSVSDLQTLNCHVVTQPEAAPLTAYHRQRWWINSWDKFRVYTSKKIQF